MEATLDSATLENYLAALGDGRSQASFVEKVEDLRALSSNASDLGQYLGSFSQGVADLFAANAVAIWFRTGSTVHGNDVHLVRKVELGWESLRLDHAGDAEHDRLVASLMDAEHASVVKPYSAIDVGSSFSNPTDSFLLFAPTRFEQSTVALIEIALGPKPLRLPHERLVRSYLQWLAWLSELLQVGMQRCFAKQSPKDPQLSAIVALDGAAKAVDMLQREILVQLESAINSFAGLNFGSLGANQTISKRVHDLLDSKGLRVKCPECGAAAILRCQKAGNSKTGAFMFDHYLESGRTFHGGQTAFPRVQLVPKPPRRKST